MILRFYALLSYLLIPFLKGYLFFRIRKGKEIPQRLCERYGIATMPRKPGKLLWLHGVSVGESLSLLSFIHYLIRLYPMLQIVLTTGTVTAARLVQSKLPPQATHQFLPLDVPLYWQRFLKHWQPSVAIVTESEVWPNMVQACQTQKVPLFLINSRLTEKSYRRWLKLPETAQKIFGGFTHIFAQSEVIAKRLRHFTSHVTVMPNLKFASQPLDIQEDKHAFLMSQMGKRPTLAFASTHLGEEEIIFPVLQELRKKYPTLLVLLAPRHVNRGDSIEKTLIDLGLSVVRRSQEQPITKDTAVFLFDTMGELGLLYSLSTIAFVGGSLVPDIGGHNPIEPAQLGRAVLWGPYMKNAADICAILEKHAFSVSGDTLYHTLHDLLSHPAKAIKAGEAIQKLVLAQKGNLKDLAKMCEPYLGPPQNEPEVETSKVRVAAP